MKLGKPYEGQIDIYLLIISYLERVWFKQRYIYIYSLHWSTIYLDQCNIFSL